MPPNRWSRDRFCSAIEDAEGTLYLTEREPYTFRELADNITHVVAAGDTLWTLAARYYAGISGTTESPSRFWWVIADFQPEPIHDPTVALQPGSTLFIPSLRTLLEEILNEARRAEHSP